VRREMACEIDRLQREVGELKSAIAEAGVKRRPAPR